MRHLLKCILRQLLYKLITIFWDDYSWKSKYITGNGNGVLFKMWTFHCSAPKNTEKVAQHFFDEKEN